jgi:hypothetical protein
VTSQSRAMTSCIHVPGHCRSLPYSRTESPDCRETQRVVSSSLREDPDRMAASCALGACLS